MFRFSNQKRSPTAFATAIPETLLLCFPLGLSSEF